MMPLTRSKNSSRNSDRIIRQSVFSLSGTLAFATELRITSQ